MESGLSLKYILKFLYRNSMSILTTTLVCIATLYYVINSSNSEIENIVKEATKERVDNIIRQYGMDYQLLCLATNCLAITKPDGKNMNIIYHKNPFDRSTDIQYGLILPKNNVRDFLKTYIPKYDLTPIAEYGSIDFYSTTTVKLQYVKDVFISNLIISVSLFITILTLITVIIRSLIKRHQEMDDRNIDRVVLQRQLTESVHHELSAPLETVRCNLEAAYKKLFPCPVEGVPMCLAPSGQTLKECADCKLYIKYKESRYRGAAWHYENICTALEQISSVLNVMSNNKHISHTNGSISLKSLFENVLASRRILSLDLLKVKVNNLDGLDTYTIGKTGGMNSGKLVNVINTLLTNSQEAHANLVEITWNINPVLSNYMDVDVKDNGRGIRDKRGKVITDIKKFKPKYGYSTKVSEFDKGEIKKLTNKALRVFKRLTNIFGNDRDDVNVRGAGLFINKTILELAGGTFKLIQNSETGCTFRLSFPVQERHDDILEEKVISKV